MSFIHFGVENYTVRVNLEKSREWNDATKRQHMGVNDDAFALIELFSTIQKSFSANFWPLKKF